MIPNRQQDPVVHALWWLGPDLVQVLHDRADICRLELHSGLVPHTSPRGALTRLKQLENRSLLVRDHKRSNHRIVFSLRDKEVQSYFMAAAVQRATAKEGAQ